jgi:O-antigen/teichoic acid export membrane protein
VKLTSRVRRSHGMRSGVVLLVATAIWTIGTAIYSLACIRYLGRQKYGDIATMIALGTIIALPLGGLQNLVAREAAHLHAVGDEGALRGLLRRMLRRSVVLGGTLTLICLVLSQPIGQWVSVDSVGAVAVGLGMVVLFAMAAVTNGVLQGVQRFGGLGAAIAVPGVVRPLLLIPILLTGMGVIGALAVNLVVATIAVGLGIFWLRDLLGKSGIHASDRHNIDRREALILVAGTLAFASLTNVDVVLANALLSDDDGGVYAAASAVAKLILIISAVVAMVLLPKATSRAAEGRSDVRILHASVIATAVVSTACALVLAVVPEGLVVRLFGADFRGSSDLLGPFGFAMAVAGVVNVYLFFYLARREMAFPLTVLAAAIVQIVIVAAWNPSAESIVWVTFGVLGAILLVHELAFPHSLLRSWRVARPGLDSNASGRT